MTPKQIVRKKRYATYDSLMRHMRKSGVHIAGSSQKRHLRLSGYFHGYKGYRFNKTPTNLIPFDSYSQVRLVIEFDEIVKSILYLPLMQLESAIKSICCDKIVTSIKSDSFSVVFEKALSNNDPLAKLRCRDSVYSAMTKRYNGCSRIVPYYYRNDKYIPIWGIIEELTLGELSLLIQTLKPSYKLSISAELGIPEPTNTDGKLLHHFILGVKDLRNAVAHNKVIFDGRYMEFQKRNSISVILESETSISGISFSSVIDDIILVVFLLKNIGFSKTQLYKVISQITLEIDKLYSKFEYSLYKEIIPSDAHAKMEKLKMYIKKNNH